MKNTAIWRRCSAALMVTSLAVALAACSTSSSGSGGTSSHPAAPAAKTNPAASPATPKSDQASGPLSGTWNGTYGGSYTGTFHLTWHQSGTHLHGTITISNPGDTLPINGVVNGSAISFGTVGSAAITYSGTVSGNSMSGRYKIRAASGNPGGPWTATKA
jgi:hypothetical protein